MVAQIEMILNIIIFGLSNEKINFQLYTYYLEAYTFTTTNTFKW